nr:FAD-binding protein [uncultured Lichenicoccus sp.]
MRTSSFNTEPLACDVLVVGFGAAALTAALTTSAAGLATLIVEKASRLGGTTAWSEAAIWVPANHHAAAAGLKDTVDDALAYVAAAAPPDWAATEAPLWRAFVQQAPRMLTFVEVHTRLRMALTAQPDPLADLPGASQAGRMLSPRPLPRRRAGRGRIPIRRAHLWHLFTFQEMLASDPLRRPVWAAVRHAPRLLFRLLTGARAQGTALVAGLLQGCLEQECQVLCGAPARALVLRDGAVRGAMVQQDGEMRMVTARQGVILASGGFEWDAERRQRHFPGLPCLVASPGSNTGVAHRMVEAIGGQLARMDQANLSPGVPTGGTDRLSALLVYFQQDPAAILVDRSGRRLAEAGDFNLGELLLRRVDGALVHLPAWCVADRGLLRRAPLLRWFARRRPGWIVCATTVGALAARIGLPASALDTTIARYNATCDSVPSKPRQLRTGSGTGSAPAGLPRMPIGPRDVVALPLVPTFVSTKGGPRTTDRGQVVDKAGRPIPGLYCCGVAMANPIGTRAVGAGTTIGPNMTWGYICGRSLVDG